MLTLLPYVLDYCKSLAVSFKRFYFDSLVEALFLSFFFTHFSMVQHVLGLLCVAECYLLEYFKMNTVSNSEEVDRFQSAHSSKSTRFFVI